MKIMDIYYHLNEVTWRFMPGKFHFSWFMVAILDEVDGSNFLCVKLTGEEV